MRMCLVLATCILAGVFSAAAKEAVGKLELAQVEELSGDKGNKIIVFKHKAIPEMDSPGYVAAGQEYYVTLGVPDGYKPEEKKSIPLILFLHGFGDTWQNIKKSPNWFSNAFIIVPNDPIGS